MLRNTFVALAALLLFATSASSEPITVDEILFDSSTNNLFLSGLVEMELTGNILSIELTNTSANAAGSGAGVLLTGIGFQLPSGVSIASGSVNMTGSTAVGFTALPGGDVSSEWGFDNDPLKSGAFLGLAALSYNTVVSSMESQTTQQFSLGSIAEPLNLNGPDFGLVSQLELDGLGTGVEAINDSVTITLLLAGAVPTDLISQIEAGDVGLSFGSPNAVPEPGSLFLVGLGVLSAARWRKSRNSLGTLS